MEDWGESLIYEMPVWPILMQRLRNSLILAALTLLLATLFGILLGIGAGLNRGRCPDHLALVSTLLAVSFPPFVTAIFLIIVMASWLQWLPASSLIDPDANLWQAIPSLVLPTVTLTLGMLAHIARHTRSSLIEVLASDYLRTATGKGLPRRTVIVRHALRNALLPTVSVIALNVGWLLNGAVLVENVFGYPGLGRLMLQAINTRDIPLLQAVVLLSAAIYALSNMTADIAYQWLNPRIRYA